GAVLTGGNPFEGPRSDHHPNKPIKTGVGPDLFGQAAKSLGYHPFPLPVATASAPYTNPDGMTLGDCQYFGHLHPTGCEATAKASPNGTITPALRADQKFVLRTRVFVSKLLYDRQAKRVTGVAYTDMRTGEEFEQPAGLVVLSSYVFGNTQQLLLAGIGEPYDHATRKGAGGQKHCHPFQGRG